MKDNDMVDLGSRVYNIDMDDNRKREHISEYNDSYISFIDVDRREE